MVTDLLVDGQAITGLVYFSVLAVGLVTMVGAACTVDAHRRAAGAWWTLCGGWVCLIASTLGFVAADINAVDLGQVHQVWMLIAIMLRLAFVAAFLVALLMLNDRMSGPEVRRRMVLDMLTVLGGGWLVIWFFILTPVLTGAQPPLGLLPVELVILPLGELFLVVGAGTVLARGSTATGRRPMIILLLAAVMWVVTDCVSTAVALDSSMSIPVRLGNVLQLAPMILTMSAASEQWRAHLSGPSGLNARVRPVTWTPYAALAGGFALLGFAAMRTDPMPWLGLVGGAAVMTYGVAARQFSVLSENRVMAITDPLTGLANRARLHEALADLPTGRRPGQRRCAVLLIDLDDFKPVNDTFGHEAGDMLLTYLAQVLRNTVRSGDVAARLGGDEFAVVLADVSGPDQAMWVAQRVLEALRSPLDIAGRQVKVTASIGMTLTQDTTAHPGHHRRPRRVAGPAPAAAIATADLLLQEADQAMYEAKREGGNTVRMFTIGGSNTRTDQANLREALRQALTHHELRVAYQPVVLLATGRLVGMEALVRWQHPTRGLLTPHAFMTVAETTRIAHDIDLWVLQEATSQVRRWQDTLRGGRGLHLNTNLTATQLSRPDLAEHILGILRHTGFDPHDLVLEITETSVFAVDTAVQQCELLRQAGVRIALDDFGTGHSSLEKLMRMPIDVLKLDRCFVPTHDQTTASTSSPATSSAIAEAVVRLADVLDLSTVAEGIETAEQATFMLELGYTHAQGYHYSKPLPTADMQALIEAEPVRPPPPTPDLSSSLSG